MSSTSKLIEKFTLCVHGEKPQEVVSVLVSFTQVLLRRWGISVVDYFEALKGGPVPPVRSEREKD